MLSSGLHLGLGNEDSGPSIALEAAIGARSPEGNLEYWRRLFGGQEPRVCGLLFGRKVEDNNFSHYAEWKVQLRTSGGVRYGSSKTGEMHGLVEAALMALADDWTDHMPRIEMPRFWIPSVKMGSYKGAVWLEVRLDGELLTVAGYGHDDWAAACEATLVLVQLLDMRLAEQFPENQASEEGYGFGV